MLTPKHARSKSFLVTTAAVLSATGLLSSRVHLEARDFEHGLHRNAPIGQAVVARQADIAIPAGRLRLGHQPLRLLDVVLRSGDVRAPARRLCEQRGVELRLALVDARVERLEVDRGSNCLTYPLVARGRLGCDAGAVGLAGAGRRRLPAGARDLDAVVHRHRVAGRLRGLEPGVARRPSLARAPRGHATTWPATCCSSTRRSWPVGR